MEFTAHNRDDIMNQLPGYKKKFLTYKSFADATIHDLFTDEELKKAYQLNANYLKSIFLENEGHGKFAIHALPAMAQLAPLNGMIAEDINGDGFLDILANGNDYGMEVASGRMDALDGLVLLGNGDGSFKALTLQQSGIFIPGNGKALVKLRSARNTYLVAATQNKSWLKLFASNKNDRQLIPLAAGDREIWYTLKNGKKRKEEVYIGNSFLSQSARFISMNASIARIEITDVAGRKRVVGAGD
jgi:hypothetical protein